MRSEVIFNLKCIQFLHHHGLVLDEDSYSVALAVAHVLLIDWLFDNIEDGVNVRLKSCQPLTDAEGYQVYLWLRENDAHLAVEMARRLIEIPAEEWMSCFKSYYYDEVEQLAGPLGDA